jgi:hypothetical protein
MSGAKARKGSNGKYRVVDSEGKVVKNKGGEPYDGGGYSLGSSAEKQAQRINWSKG